MFHMENVPVEDQKMSVRYKLRDCPYEFYLTGSRYFGNTRPASDWDFFTTWTQRCEDFLRSIGFKCIHGSAYKDMQLVKLMRWMPPPPESPVDPPSREPQIDIQMVRDAGLKERAQAYIFSNPMLLQLYLELKLPSKRDVLWDLVYAAANGLLYEGAMNSSQERSNKQNVHNILANFIEAPSSMKISPNEGEIPF